MEDILQEVVEELAVELEDDPDFNANILTIKVKNAIRKVKSRRNYQVTSMTDEQIDADLKNYYTNIKDIALRDYNLRGAEGEKSHSEEKISRTYLSDDELLQGVHAFVKVL